MIHGIISAISRNPGIRFCIIEVAKKINALATGGSLILNGSPFPEQILQIRFLELFDATS